MTESSFILNKSQYTYLPVHVSVLDVPLTAAVLDRYC